MGLPGWAPMTDIGNEQFPEMTLSQALEAIDRIKREKVQTTVALAKVYGYTNFRSGAFFNRLAALTKFYGFLEREGTSIQLTSLAKRIVYPVSDPDRQLATREAVGRVTLLTTLYKELGRDYHTEDFPTKLLQITGASHEDLQQKAPRVEKLYRDAVSFMEERGAATPGRGLETLTPDGSDLDVPGDTGVDPQRRDPRPSPGFHLPADERHWMFQDGDTVLRVQKDARKVKLAIGVLQVWLEETKENPPVLP
jgi:hypothetical protein